jgi:gliding motility-associated-like protein
MDVHLVRSFLTGKKILKAKRDFYDPYLWVLAENNEVYRINSIDYTVDDFTSKFANYKYPFIDIAGRSKDTVFVAGNVGVVIEYKKGIVQEISNGIPGKVNSIGMTGLYNYSLSAKTELQIATDHGICAFNYKSETIQGSAVKLESKILETTYRTQMYHNMDKCVCEPASVQKYGVTEQLTFNKYGGELYLDGNLYGSEIKTAYFTTGNAYLPDGQIQSNGLQYWATEKGLFVNRSYDSGSAASPLEGHYLDTKNISKITSIYGMLGFGTSVNSTYVKENILVGTSEGLYFSNSQYQVASSLNYNFNYCSELGNKAINDICVNANTYLSPTAFFNYTFCEDGIWVSANDGLYLLKPDYEPYSNLSGKLPAIAFEGSDIAVTDLQTCSPVNVKANLTQFFLYSQLGVQWFKNGQALTGETNNSLIITDAGEYNAMVYDPCTAVHIETNHLKVTTSAAPVISFNYPDKVNYCFGSTATLSTTNNANYLYRWYKDGVLNGNTTGILNTTQPGKYKLEVSTCAGGWIPTKEVEITFIHVPKPSITSDQPVYCPGSQAILTASVPPVITPIVNWQDYQYRWFKDGNLIPNVNTISIAVTQPGKYTVEASSCSGNAATSAEFKPHYLTTNLIAIKPDKPGYCVGDNATLSTSFVNDGTYTLTWLLNDAALDDNKNKTSITTNQPGSYKLIVSSNLVSCSNVSLPYNLSVETTPTLIIEKLSTATLCDGQTVDLKATYSGGTVKWSTGAATDKINVNQTAVYTATVKTAAGCEVSKDISVQFLPNPVINVPNATLCPFTNQTLTLTAPPGFGKYQWNGQTGTSNFSTSQLGKVTLTVTDNNGCTATQTINITSHCDNINLPSAFTPNGDGINDTWIIEGLQGDLTTTVKVFNRYGETVFKSTGYAVQWNGTLDGKKLPAGVYYYVISAQASNKVINGTVTIIY